MVQEKDSIEYQDTTQFEEVMHVNKVMEDKTDPKEPRPAEVSSEAEIDRPIHLKDIGHHEVDYKDNSNQEIVHFNMDVLANLDEPCLAMPNLKTILSRSSSPVEEIHFEIKDVDYETQEDVLMDMVIGVKADFNKASSKLDIQANLCQSSVNGTSYIKIYDQENLVYLLYISLSDLTSTLLKSTTPEDHTLK